MENKHEDITLFFKYKILDKKKPFRCADLKGEKRKGRRESYESSQLKKASLLPTKSL